MTGEAGADPTPTDPAALLAKAGALGVEVREGSAERLLAYLDAMLALNQQVNLTGIRDREQAVVLHALDGLCFDRLGLRPQHVLDLGSGNGFPGVAVAALHPEASVVLMERTGKKVRAMGTCLMTVGLSGVETVHLDAAQAPTLRRDLRAAFDVVTARAVGKPEQVAALAEPLCRPGGHLILWLEEQMAVPERLGAFRLVRSETYTLPEPAPRTRVIAAFRLG